MDIINKLYYKQGSQTFTYDATTRKVTAKTSYYGYRFRACYALGNGDENHRFEMSTSSGKVDTQGGSEIYFFLDDDYDTLEIYGAATEQGYLSTTPNNAITSITYGITDYITITPNDGYTISECSAYASKTINGTITDNAGKITIYNKVGSSGITVKATITQDRPQTVINNNIDNTTYNYDSDANQLTVQGATGYTLQSCTANCDGTDIVGNVVDGVCTFEFGSNYYSTVIISGSATETTTTITNNINNANYVYTKNSNTLTVQGNKHYILQSCTANCDGTDIVGNVVDGVCTFEFGSNYYSTVILSGSTVGETITITNNTTYVKGTIPENINYGDVLNISLTPIDNYTYSTTPDTQKPYIRYKDNYGDYITKYFDVADDVATISFYAVNVTGQNIEVLGGATPKPYTTKNYGTVNVYVVTDTDLEKFTQRRWQTVTGETTRFIEDVGDYIYSIKRIFLQGENGYEDTLKIGDYNFSDIKVHQPKQDTVTANYRTNILSEMSSAQFANCQVKIFVPFKGLIDIGNEIFHHEYCGLILSVNLLSGLGTITVYVEDEGERTNIYYDDFEPSSDVMYTTSNNNVIGQLATNDVKENWGLSPYFAIYSNSTYSGDNDTILSCKMPLLYPLKNFSGLMTFEGVSLGSDNSIPLMNKDDIEEIKSLLSSGVVL